MSPDVIIKLASLFGSNDPRISDAPINLAGVEVRELNATFLDSPFLMETLRLFKKSFLSFKSEEVIQNLISFFCRMNGLKRCSFPLF